MKKVYNILSMLALAAVFAMAGCSEESHRYSGPEFVLFAAEEVICPVRAESDYNYEIIVGATRRFTYDRTFGIQAVFEKSNAVEGRHYELLSDNVVIKAGEFTAGVPIRGYFDEIGDRDETYVTLRVVARDDLFNESYGDTTRVVFRKACDWDVDYLLEDGGYYVVTESFSAGDIKRSLTKAEKIDDERIVFINPFGSGRDMRVRFNLEDDDIYTTEITVLPQLYFNFGEHNMGWVYLRTHDRIPSYLSHCQRLLDINLELYTEGFGTFGFFPATFMWVSKEEADYLFPGHGL